MVGIGADDLYERVKDYTDHQWFDLLRRSITGADVGGVPLPSFPSEDMQFVMHGHTNEVAVHEASLFYREVRQLGTACDRALSPERTLLDFGTGWGRMVRPFMKDIPGSRLYGVEPHPERIVAARECNPYVNFVQSNYQPPLPLASGSMDFITAWSVFSHLNEETGTRWIAELARLLRPGGLLFLTTQGTMFFEYIERLRAAEAAGDELAHPWQHGLLERFPDIDAARRLHEAGEFVFAGEDSYGEAIVPKAYIRAHWCDGLELRAFVNDRARLPQALAVLQRPV
jgi:SAM-dependent methyltransferase